MPIGVNPKTRESRLVKSTSRYIWRSSQSIIRSFALYKPFRFFFLVGMVPFVIGVLLMLRWLVAVRVRRRPTPAASRACSAGIGLIVVAAQIWAVAFLADLQSASRRVLDELRLRAKRIDYGDADHPTGPTSI